MPIDATTTRRWLEVAAERLAEERVWLTELDSAIGDADHGANMERGFAAAAERARALPDATPGQLLIAAGMTIMTVVAGSAGALWGSALRRAGKVLGDASSVEPAVFADALDAALAAMQELGGALEGQATMLDALGPGLRALRERLPGEEFSAAAAAAAAAAANGARATVAMRATKGRGSYLGERSVGHQDPGATSAAIVLDALAVATAGPPTA